MRGVLRCFLIISAVVGVFPTAEAQPLKKLPRIGFLFSLSPSPNAARIEAFRQVLRKLGYVEGKNIVIEYRWADGRIERLPDLASELVRLKVDVIVSAGPTVTRAGKAATRTIPIVMAWDNDPVGNGFAASLARPGGNITGLSNLASEISGKQLELLKEMVPRLSRVSVLWTSNEPGTTQALRAAELAAGALRVQLQSLDVRDPKDIETAFGEVSKWHADALLVVSTRVFFSQRKHVVDLAAKHRLPAAYGQPEYVEAGGLMAYGPSFTDLYRRAATYVDKILKGAKPADLPVEQPTTFDLVINLKTAKSLGLTIPKSILIRADEVIE